MGENRAAVGREGRRIAVGVKGSDNTGSPLGGEGDISLNSSGQRV